VHRQRTNSSTPDRSIQQAVVLGADFALTRPRSPRRSRSLAPSLLARLAVEQLSMERDDRGRAAQHQRRRVEIARRPAESPQCRRLREPLAGIRSKGWRARALSARATGNPPAGRLRTPNVNWRCGIASDSQQRKTPAGGRLEPEEVARLLDAAPGLKYKAALSVAYGAGLRASEVISLKVSDSARMVIRVEQGKGRDRVRGRPSAGPCGRGRSGCGRGRRGVRPAR
jgi:integrase